MCVEGQRELYQAGVLNSGHIISQIAQLTLHALVEQFLYNSSVTSCGLHTPSSFLMVNSTALGALWKGFIDSGGVCWF